MSVCTFIGLIIAAIGTIIAVVSGLTTSIDKRIDEKLKDAAFLKQVAKEVRLPFIIFDEDVRYLHVSEADRFIER